MKHLALTICISFFTLICFAQTPVEYKYVNGELYGVDSVGNYIRLANHKYSSKEIPTSIKGYTPPISITAIQEPTKTTLFNKYIKKSGNLMIGASVLVLGGTLLTVVGVSQDIPALYYAGTATGSISILFFLGSGVMLRKAGQTEMKKL